MTETRTRQQESPEEKLPAQYINYVFLALDPMWRRLPDEERERGKREFREAAEEHSAEMLLRSFSLMGLRADADFMLWRIGYDLDAFESMTAALLKTGLGKFLRVSYSYFALSRRSVYVGEHTPGFENRTYIVPGEGEYLFVYPFVKTRAWYRLPMEERQRMMNEHMQHRAQALPRKEQHGLLLRDRRLRVHPLVRGRVSREVPGPDDGAQGERGERLHGARHPHLYLPPPKPTRNSAEPGLDRRPHPGIAPPGSCILLSQRTNHGRAARSSLSAIMLARYPPVWTTNLHAV